MQYRDISDTMLLSYEVTKVAVYEETKALFQDAPMLLELWEQDVFHTTEEEMQNEQPKNEAFRELFNLITKDLTNFKVMTKRIIRNTVESYKDTIIHTMLPYAEVLSDELDFTKPMKDQNYILSDSSTTFYLMRNIVTSKKGFSDNGRGHLESELIDNQGQLHGLAELRPAPLVETEPTDHFIDAVESTLSSLDELTADIFDLVSYMWMTGEHTSDGFIEFHSDDALLLQHAQEENAGEHLKFKERDRFNIMRRVAALTSVWVALNEGTEKLKIVDAREIKNSKLYKFQDFKRMFEVGNVRIAFDKKTNKPKGIYALEIKPSSLLQPYLNGTKSSLGVLDLKVFKYSYYTQREHKRLTRYLSRQWKIRSMKGSLHQPFKIDTLLHEMNFPERLNGVQLRDKFEEVLDDLQTDEVIKAWTYSEPIDEARVGKRGWVKNYWSQMSVTIMPPDIVVYENKKRIPLPHMQHDEAAPNIEEDIVDAVFEEVAQPEQEAFDLEDVETEVVEEVEVTLTPETMRAKIDTLGLSIRKAAEEMGMSHTTLSRYMNHKIKRHNKDNDKKMIAFLKAH
ncbi:hypothetical protein [Kurthia massiliensis]|uniref:hypothetical protein n=1 Tax=Kurthia massiliensis TaxID=1033739 RepID=UPI000288EEE1|nr:hypothetical protein [Kurthia massiliensis]